MCFLSDNHSFRTHWKPQIVLHINLFQRSLHLLIYIMYTPYKHNYVFYYLYSAGRTIRTLLTLSLSFPQTPPKVGYHKDPVPLVSQPQKFLSWIFFMEQVHILLLVSSQLPHPDHHVQSIPVFLSPCPFYMRFFCSTYHDLRLSY